MNQLTASEASNDEMITDKRSVITDSKSLITDRNEVKK